MLILHQISELSGLPNAPDIYGIPVLEPCIEFRTHEPRARPRGLIPIMNEGARAASSPRAPSRVSDDACTSPVIQGIQS